MAQSPDAATLKRYKDLLVHYSPADARMTRSTAGPLANAWLRADRVIGQSVATLEDLQQELRNTGVGWMAEFALMNSDGLDDLWQHSDKGFRAYEVCQLTSSIEMFCESVKHYEYGGDEDAVRAAMRASSTSDRNTFLVNHVRRNQEGLFNLSWRIIERRAKMLDAERTQERFQKQIEDGKRRKEEEERRLLSNAVRPKAPISFNRSNQQPQRVAISMFTSPATPTTTFATNRSQSELTKLDRDLSKEFIGRFKESTRINSEPASEDEDTEGYDEDELLNYSD